MSRTILGSHVYNSLDCLWEEQRADAPFLPTFLLLGFALNVLSAWGRLFSSDADFTGVGLIIPGGLRLNRKGTPYIPHAGKGKRPHDAPRGECAGVELIRRHRQRPESQPLVAVRLGNATLCPGKPDGATNADISPGGPGLGWAVGEDSSMNECGPEDRLGIRPVWHPASGRYKFGKQSCAGCCPLQFVTVPSGLARC